MFRIQWATAMLCNIYGIMGFFPKGSHTKRTNAHNARIFLSIAYLHRMILHVCILFLFVRFEECIFNIFHVLHRWVTVTVQWNFFVPSFKQSLRLWVFSSVILVRWLVGWLVGLFVETQFKTRWAKYCDLCFKDFYQKLWSTVIA